MNLHALRLFREIAVTGTVSGAAERLNISQPAVTIQLRKLEKELGFALTRPHGRGIVMTEAGSWLFAQADRLFLLEADIDAQCEAYRRGERGDLKLAATYLPANFMLPAWIGSFRHSSPEVKVAVASGNAQAVLTKLLHYEADIAWIGGQHSLPPSIISLPCYEDELWFVAPPDHRLAAGVHSLGELAKEPFILREPGSFTREALFSLYRTAGVTPPQPAVQLDGPQETIRAAVEGLGITIASRMEVQTYVDAGLLARLETNVPPVANPISRCVRAGDPLPPAAVAFLNALDGMHC
ncbi:LysR family transcriptional regulator [Paenibacillus piri]|uniref:LysR family transcriptional regulator n=1 Tax=Paenibacillus piri TaxID=2547395 RepID=A0A4R5KAE0_9BACL|nr:LysR family transcriptional regulator [Paenibacillus piri]TDF91996.1 LysR family transcriptional regulator [Paenibacillus piri]